MKSRKLFLAAFLAVCSSLSAQQAVPVGGGSYASYPPLAESRSDLHGGCLAYQTEHRRIYAVDSLQSRPLPSNDWWTYALVNQWTGKLWAYPALVWADASGVSVAKPTYWEPTGCEMKWDNALLASALRLASDGRKAPFSPKEALLSDWSDYMIAFVLRDGESEVRTTVMHGSPIVWLEYTGAEPVITNPDSTMYAVYRHSADGKTVVAVAVLTDGLTRADLDPYAFRIPRRTRIDYAYNASLAQMTTTFHIDYEDIVPTSAQGIVQGFLPHHYYNTRFATAATHLTATYMTPRGTMRLAEGNDFRIDYTVHGMLPYFPLPKGDLAGYSPERLRALCAQYAAAGSFGADTYWGGKGLTQMMHYMTAAYQLGDTATFELAKQRLRTTLEDWFTYTPGETQFYFARYPHWGALVGFDPSYDSDTFNDHHFHYGYFVYASAVLCLFDSDFRTQYGPMVREVVKDYANYDRTDTRYPLFRTLDPYCGHSFAGGMGNEGNGNGQESSSEAMQSWGGVWMLGAALGDQDMLEAGIFGYTLEARATAEYWFDRNRRNIDYTKYQHPYCCNLTMQGVGWWTWFSGDPVWMHSIQWLPISPVLQNYLSEDLDFARWDYTQMYAKKEVGNYEAAFKGLGDESGLGNVCLSYLALFDPDSAARVWDRMDRMGKALAKNADTGGITYMLTHGLRAYGAQNHAITADSPLAAAYTTPAGKTTYMVYNAGEQEIMVGFSDGKQWRAPAGRLSIFDASPVLTSLVLEGDRVVLPSSDNRYTLRFLDQYGAAMRSDSTLLFAAPALAGDTLLRAAYGGLEATLRVRIGALPYMANATIVPAIDYLALGNSVDFSLSATDQYAEPFPVDWHYRYAPSSPGKDTIRYQASDGTQVERALTVLPPYPNLALGKSATASSEENAGTLVKNINDGDTGSRWGSAHRDGEYVTIDLGQSCFIDYVVLRWEAAYANRFSLSLTETRPAGVDSSAVYTSSGGVQTLSVGKQGRYLQLCGLSRATQYGTSLYEIEAYGIPSAGDPDALFGLAIYADREVLTMGEQVHFSVRGYNMRGEEIACTPVLTATGGTIAGNTLSPTAIGTTILTATVGTTTVSRSFTVLETEVITSAAISPKEVTLPLGESQVFTISALNQFGYTEAESSELYEATTVGDHQLILSIGGYQDTATIHIVAYSEMNLALGKPATCSGSEWGGTDGSAAVDGDMNTRWSSRFQDGEWLTVDLGDSYYLTNMRIYWQDAFATRYTILLSEDGVDYEAVYTRTDNPGGKDEITLPAGRQYPARFVRLLCHERNTGYGSSLWEFEVFGSGKVPSPTTDLDATNRSDETNRPDEPNHPDGTNHPRKAVQLLYRDGHIYILSPDRKVYTLTGSLVSE